MKVNYALHKGLTSFVILLIASMFIGSCKKDTYSKGSLTDAERIDKAKAWYDEAQKASKVKLVSSKGKQVSLIFNPQWNDAVVENIDGNTVIAMQVSTNINTLMGEKTTSYNLLITLDGKDGYVAKTVSTNNFGEKESSLNVEELYRTAFTTTDLTKARTLFADVKVFNQNFTENKHVLFALNQMRDINTQKNAPKLDLGTFGEKNTIDKTAVTVYTVCTNWWFILDFYDANDNLVASEITYLGMTCQDHETEQIDFIEPPMFGGSDTTRTRGDFGEPFDGATTVTEISDEDSGPDMYKSRYYTWVFHRDNAMHVNYECYSKSRIKKAYPYDGDWKFVSYKYLNAYPVGEPAGQSSEVMMLDAETGYSDYIVFLHIFYKIHKMIQGFSTQGLNYSEAHELEKQYTIGQ